MRILGIDCGSERSGYGVIESDGHTHRLCACGVIQTDPKQPFDRRLLKISLGLREIVRGESPEEAAVEEVFHAANVKTALKLAHVRGVVLATLAEAGIPIGEYSALEVKTSVVGYGRAEKHQVQLMTCSLLRLGEPVDSEDAADALAVAICHANRTAHRRRLEAAR